MSKNKKIIICFLFFVFCFLIYLWQGIYLPKDFGGAEQILFSIEKGQGISQIAQNLEKQGIIKNKIFFEIYVFLRGESKRLKAGDYFLSSEMSIPQISEKIVAGDVIREKIIIIEGWNLRDIGFYLEEKGMFRAEEFWEVVGFPAFDYSKTKYLPNLIDFSSDYDFLKEKPKNVGLEGYLFPDTYEVHKGITIEEIIRKMLDNFDRKISPDLRTEIDRQDKSIFEILTMASLLEKEIKTFEDRQIVSGILWKRLKAGIPLQVDATITYITGKKTIIISKEETEIDSPYNTYKYLGLPIGPICNPGLESIRASLYPKDSEYLYYLSTPEGETIFSKTLEEHNIAKAKYLQ